MHWTQYVERVAQGRRQADIADMAGVNQSTVSNWLRGKGHVSPENAMNLSRMAGDGPIVGLLAAGYLREDEVDGVVRIDPDITKETAGELLTELGRRLGLNVSVRKGAAG